MPEIVPIPGTTSAEWVAENSGAVELSEDEMRQVDEILVGFEVAGDRYPAWAMKNLDG